jgi:hypothetical protein
VSLILDAFWRAAAYCLHPRVIGLSLLPLALMVGATLALGWFYWEAAIDAVQLAFEDWELTGALFGWLDAMGLSGLRTVLAPMTVVFLATPVIVVASLLLVTTLMTGRVVALVAARRFPDLERKRGGSFVGSLLAAGVATVVALVLLVASVPLWFVPPLVLVLPPLIWGWLTYRVMSRDVLADHASPEERRELVERHRWPLLAIGVASGVLGATPSVVWASGLVFVALAPVLVPIAIWIYTLVFAFSALWFAHYGLSALSVLRAEPGRSADPLPPAAAAAARLEQELPP